jgi:hypothetical protein
MTDIAANLTDADSFYEQLLNAHLGLDEQASALLNAKLILVMANHIGDPMALSRCIEAAKAGDAPPQKGD